MAASPTSFVSTCLIRKKPMKTALNVWPLACALVAGLALNPLPALAQDASPKPMMQGGGHQEGQTGPLSLIHI